MTEQELEQAFPAIDWHAPITVHVPKGTKVITRLACRFCIAQKGLKAADVGRIPVTTRAAHRRHLLIEHGIEWE